MPPSPPTPKRNLVYRPALFTRAGAELASTARAPEGGAPLARASDAELELIQNDFDFELGAGGWGNEELQTYVGPEEGLCRIRHLPSTRPQVLDDDDDGGGGGGGGGALATTPSGRAPALVLEARIDIDGGGAPRYRSVRLTGKVPLGIHSGYLEAHIEAPLAKGVWPAFWLLPRAPFTWPEDGEVDLLETWDDSARNGTCLHWGHFTPEHNHRHRVLQQPLTRRRMREGGPDDDDVEEVHLGAEGSRGPGRAGVLRRADTTEVHVVGLAWQDEPPPPPVPPGRATPPTTSTSSSTTTTDPTQAPRGRLVWYLDSRPVMRAPLPRNRAHEFRRNLADFVPKLNVALGGNVQRGSLPPPQTVAALRVLDYAVWDAPPRGWGGGGSGTGDGGRACGFEADWLEAPEGEPMAL